MLSLSLSGFSGLDKILYKTYMVHSLYGVYSLWGEFFFCLTQKDINYIDLSISSSIQISKLHDHSFCMVLILNASDKPNGSLLQLANGLPLGHSSLAMWSFFMIVSNGQNLMIRLETGSQAWV